MSIIPFLQNCLQKQQYLRSDDMHLIGLVTLNCLLFRPLILLSVVRFLTILSPFKGCARSPLSLALGARANCRTSFLCSPDSCCNKTYLCFGQTAMMTLPATFTLNENCRTFQSDMLHLFVYISHCRHSSFDLYSHCSNIHSVTRASWPLGPSCISETFQSPLCRLQP